MNNIRIVFLIIDFPRFTRRQLYEIYTSVSTENILTALLNFVNSEQIWSSIKPSRVPHYLKLLKNRIQTFISEFRKRWQKCSRTKEHFERVNEKWLNDYFKFPDILPSDLLQNDLPSTSTRGRPVKKFDDLCKKSKIRKTTELRNNYSLNELAFATKVSLKDSGLKDASKVLKESTMTTPTRASKIRLLYLQSTTSKHVMQKYTSDEALALLVDLKLTKYQYQNLRTQAQNKNANIYPTYNSVRDAKIKCYPNLSEISVTETKASIHLQISGDSRV